MTEKKKVNICSQFVDRKSNSTGYMWHNLILFLEEDFNIKVISTDGDGTKNNYFTIKSTKLNYSFIGRLISLSSIAISIFIKMLKVIKSNEIIITGTNPVILLFFIPFLKRMKKLKWVLIVHDLYPWNLFVNQNIKNKVLKNSLEFFFKKIYDEADQIIVIGSDMKDYLSRHTKSNIQVIQNWVSTEDVQSIDRSNSTILKHLGLGKEFTVFQFFGNIGPLQDIENILKAITLVEEKSARFLFIGSGSKSYLIDEYIEKYHLNNLINYGPLEMSENCEGLSACDIAIVSLHKDMLGLGVPSKSYFSMASDKPILAIMDSKSEISQAVKNFSLGWCCAPNDPSLLASMIDEICIGNKKVIEGPRSKFIKHYSSDVLLSKFSKLLNSL